MRHCEYWLIGRVLANRDNLGRFIKGHRHRSEETKKKISNKNSGEFHPMFGKNFSKERKDKISKVLKGRTITKEWREKISISKKGTHSSIATEWKRGEHSSIDTEFKKGCVSGKNNPFYGRKHTEETKRKISLSLIGNQRARKRGDI